MSIIAGIKSFFGYSGVIDTAAKAVDKIFGLNDITSFKTQFFIDPSSGAL